MKFFRVKTNKLSGTDFREVYNKTYNHYLVIKRKTKRRPYVRSAYFNKEKIFLGLYWHHIHEKENFRDKVRRMKYFPGAIELIRYSRYEPTSKENPNRRSEFLHRFAGQTPEGDHFFVQIKEDKVTGQKWLISTFPA